MAKPISIQLYTLREQAKTDFVGVLKTVAGIGYKAVETAGYHGLKPAEVRKIVEDLGMVVSSLHGAWPTQDNLQEVVDTAKALGTTITISGFGPDQFKTVAEIQKVADKANAVIPALQKAGIQLAMHNHWWEFDQVEGRLAFDLLMERCPGLLSELDIYWASNFGKVKAAEQVAKYKGRIPLLHIKDGPLVKDQPHTAVGAGKVDIPACLRAADEKVLRYAVVELDACATDMVQAVKDSYKYLVGKGLAIGNKPA
jgi:sugar phosphate isomerase/epimerase